MRVCTGTRNAIVFLVVFLFAVGAKLPGVEEEYTNLHDWVTAVREIDIYDPRDPDPPRKASQDKWPGLGGGDDLLDMEQMYWPHFDVSPWNWEVPDGFWPNFDTGIWIGSWYQQPFDGKSIYSFVCYLSQCPNVVDCEDEKFIWKKPVSSSQILLDYGAEGDSVFKKPVLNNDGDIVVYVKNAEEGGIDGDKIHVWYEKAFQGQPGNTVICEKYVTVECDECDCDTADAFSFDDSSTPDTVARNNSIDVYITGGCPPFTWSEAADNTEGGNDFSLQYSETTSRVNSLSAGANACGTVKVTVTDACGDTVYAYIRCTTGVWVLQWGTSPGNCFKVTGPHNIYNGGCRFKYNCGDDINFCVKNDQTVDCTAADYNAISWTVDPEDYCANGWAGSLNPTKAYCWDCP